MKKVLLFLITSAFLYANECHYEMQNLDLEWEAYKTPLKIGVKGSFEKIDLSAKDKSSQKSFLKTTTVTIDTTTVNSKNSARDAKLVQFFFNVQKVKKITVQAVSLDDNILSVDITMNGITKRVPMKVEFDDEIEAKGHIDLADFHMIPSLKSINKACFELHKGKTWQDLEIEFELKLHKVCK